MEQIHIEGPRPVLRRGFEVGSGRRIGLRNVVVAGADAEGDREYQHARAREDPRWEEKTDENCSDRDASSDLPAKQQDDREDDRGRDAEPRRDLGEVVARFEAP